MDLPAGTSIIGFADDALVVCAADSVGILELSINETLQRRRPSARMEGTDSLRNGRSDGMVSRLGDGPTA